MKNVFALIFNCFMAISNAKKPHILNSAATYEYTHTL